jgi:hypothetical protein
LSLLALARSSSRSTAAICASLEMFWEKKMTPAASPCRISLSRPAGGVRPL